MSLREQILGAEDLPRQSVDTPEWAPAVPSVTVRGLTAAERDQYEQGLTERTPDGSVRPRRNLKNLRASFVVRVVVNDDGSRVFTDDDIDVLGEKSALVLDRLWDVGRALSGMQTEVETEENPSTGEQDGDNSSASVSP